MSKICSSCGAENVDEAKFCRKCGNKNFDISESKVENFEKTKSNRKYFFIEFISTVIFLLLLGMYIFDNYLNDNNLSRFVVIILPLIYIIYQLVNKIKKVSKHEKESINEMMIGYAVIVIVILMVASLMWI